VWDDGTYSDWLGSRILNGIEEGWKEEVYRRKKQGVGVGK